jgi:hypothetical protein
MIDKLDKFLSPEELEKVNAEKTIDNKNVVKVKTELVEKVDRKLVVEDGRELLREVTYKIF